MGATTQKSTSSWITTRYILFSLTFQNLFEEEEEEK
jgi:hypothetical protein